MRSRTRNHDSSARRERSFRDAVVVITGGAGGIGRAFAQRFGDAGARIALLDLQQEALDRAVAGLEDAGVSAVGIPCDVTDPEACRGAVDETCRRFGGIDVLMANAGLVHRSGFAETRFEVFRRVMEVNFFGALYCVRAALDGLIERRGLVVVTSSIAGLAPLYGRSGYAASKHALHGLFESARAELADRGVGLLIVCPGFTDSDFEKAALGADGEPIGRPRTMVGSLASAGSVAEAVFAAAGRDRQRLVLSPVGKTAALLSRLAPSLYDRLMVRRLRRELQAGESEPVRSPR